MNRLKTSRLRLPHGIETINNLRMRRAAGRMACRFLMKAPLLYAGAGDEAVTSASGERAETAKPTPKVVSRSRYTVMTAWVCLLLAVAFFFSVFGWGDPRKAVRLAASVFLNIAPPEGMNRAATVRYLLNYVLPMNLGILITGGALALSGAAFQGLFQNPLASPDILGATSGASLGGGIYVLLFTVTDDSAGMQTVNDVHVTLSAEIGRQSFIFLSGVLTVILIVAIGIWIGKGVRSIANVVLSGLIVSSVLNSILSCIRYVIMQMNPDDDRIPLLNTFLYGKFLNVAQVPNLIKLAVPILIFTVPLLLLRYKFNVLAFGDEEAKALGENVTYLRVFVMLCSTILTTTTIAMVGQIGWVGLAIPHLSRLLVGPDFKRLLPFSMLTGGLFLLLAQAVSNLGHLPVGVYTSIIGAPLFLYFLVWSRRKGNREGI